MQGDRNYLGLAFPSARCQHCPNWRQWLQQLWVNGHQGAWRISCAQARRVQRKLDGLTNTQLKLAVSEFDHLPRGDACWQQAHSRVLCGFWRFPFDANIVRACQASGYARAMTATYHAVIGCALRHSEVQASVMQDKRLPRIAGVG